MISPTTQGIRRADKWGNGEYGQARGEKLHKGGDYICEPGQSVVSPIAGLVIRRARPYRKGKFSGLLIQGRHIAVKMFYLKPEKNIIGRYVHQGDTVGIAQDISEKYPGMTPHIHVRIDSADPEILTCML